MLRKLSWVLALLALCSVPIVYSLGLGEINLHSGLNQPLSADIDLYSVRTRDADSIKVLLGSDHDFASAGLQRPNFLSQLRFSVEPRGKQHYVIHVSTEQAVREPLLDFLIRVTWQGGQLLRQYTVPLNPPALMAAPDAATQQSFGAPLSDTALATVQQQESPKLEATTTAEALPPLQTASAAEAKPEDVAKSEVVGIPEVPAKPEVIAKPAAVVKTEMATKPVTVAERDVVAKHKVAAKPAAAADNHTEYGPVRPGETLSAIANSALPDQSVTVNQKMQAILQANPEAFIGNNINNLKTGRILRLPTKSEISAINPKQALIDTRAQLNAWRRRQGIAVATMAGQPAEKPLAAETATEKPLATEKTAPKTTAVTPAPQAPATPSRQAQLKLVPPPHEGAQTAESGTRKGAQKEPAIDNEAVAAQRLETQDLNTRLAALEQQLTIMQKMMALKDQQLAVLQAQHATAPGPLNNPDSLLAIIGVLAAGLVAMLWITMRRPQPAMPDLLRETLPASPPTAAAPAAPAKRKPQAPQPAAHAGNEPLAETGINSEIDVYIAYGRYHQAVDLIKEAMVHDHSDELKLKLLEVYYAAKNASAFEDTANSLRAEVGADTELWRKVVPMGQELCPKSLLFTSRRD